MSEEKCDNGITFFVCLWKLEEHERYIEANKLGGTT